MSETCRAPCSPATLNYDDFDVKANCDITDLVPLLGCGAGKDISQKSIFEFPKNQQYFLWSILREKTLASIYNYLYISVCR